MPVLETPARPAPAPPATNATPAGAPAAPVGTPPTPTPPPPHHWDLGAGLGFGTGVSNLGADSALAMSAAPLRLSLERALTESTWLMLNGSFSHVGGDVPVSNAADPSARNKVSVSDNTLIIQAGVRQIVVSSLVDVSLFGGLEVGNEWVNGEGLTTDERSTGPQAGTSAKLFGVIVGMAVERELVPSLALRLAADLASATWLWTTSQVYAANGPVTTRLNRNGLAVGVEPSIELRLYF